MTMRNKLWAAAAALALVAGLPGLPGISRAPGQMTKPADAEPAPPYKILQERPDRLIVELPDRLIAVVQEVHTAPVVSAQMFVKTGSNYEQEHVGAGLSHFLEHLLAGGSTTTRGQDETRKMLGQIGAGFNAYTSLDFVNYHINTTSDHAATAVGLISDWMRNSLITPREYQREGMVIQREFDMGEGTPGRVIWMALEQSLHKFHPVRHPTIGYIADFLSITRDEIYNFYKRMYVPNNMVMVVVGDVNKKEIVDQIAGLWAHTPAGPLPKLSFPIEPPISQPQSVSGVAIITAPRLTFAWPGTRMAGPHDYAMDLLAQILGQGESSRLVRAVRDEAGAVTFINADNSSFAWGEGNFEVDCQVRVEQPADGSKPGPEAANKAIARATELILAQVERMKTQDVTPEELARAKRKVMAAVVMSAQSADGLGTRLVEDLINTGNPDYVKYYAQAVQGITAADIRQAANLYLVPNRLVTITLEPLGKGEKIKPMVRPPEEPKPADLKYEPVDLDNSAIVEKFDQQAGHDAASPPAPPVQVGDVHRFELSNGVRLLVQRNTLVPAVSIQMYQLGGLLSDDAGKEGIANAAAAMLTKGTTTRTAQQIAAQVENLGAELSGGGGSNTLYVQASCLKDDWATLLELTADVTLNPTFPEKEWSNMKSRIVAGIAREKDGWGGELRGHFREVYFGPQCTWSQSASGRAEVVDAAKAEDLARFYREHLGANQTVLAVFGDVDEKEVVRKAEALFAAMPQRPLRPFVATIPLPPQAGLWEFTTERSMAGVEIGFGPAPTRKSDDYAAVEVLNRVLSAFPSGWLEGELRGKGPGLVYSVGAGMFTGLAPGYVAITFNTQPSTAAEALKRTGGVVRRAIDTQVDDATLTRAKASVLTDEFFYKQTNSDRAADAALNELYGLGPDAPQRYLARVRRLDAKELQVIARTYLRNPVTVVITGQEIPKDALIKALGLEQPPATAPAEPAAQ